MPPRSVCLNVFTTSLGNDVGLGKEREVGVEVTEVGDKMEGVETVVERERHDSVQGPPNGTLHCLVRVSYPTGHELTAMQRPSSQDQSLTSFTPRLTPRLYLLIWVHKSRRPEAGKLR
jgi:hypothetical protein